MLSTVNMWGEQLLDMELWLVLSAMKSLNEEKLLQICRTLRKNFKSFTVFSHHWQLPGSVAEDFFDIDWLLIIYYTISTIVTFWFIICCLLSLKWMCIFHVSKKLFMLTICKQNYSFFLPIQAPPKKKHNNFSTIRFWIL